MKSPKCVTKAKSIVFEISDAVCELLFGLRVSPLALGLDIAVLTVGNGPKRVVGSCSGALSVGLLFHSHGEVKHKVGAVGAELMDTCLDGVDAELERGEIHWARYDLFLFCAKDPRRGPTLIGNRASRHVVADDLSAVELDDAAIIDLQIEEEARYSCWILHHEGGLEQGMLRFVVARHNRRPHMAVPVAQRRLPFIPCFAIHTP